MKEYGQKKNQHAQVLLKVCERWLYSCIGLANKHGGLGLALCCVIMIGDALLLV